MTSVAGEGSSPTDGDSEDSVAEANASNRATCGSPLAVSRTNKSLTNPTSTRINYQSIRKDRSREERLSSGQKVGGGGIPSPVSPSQNDKPVAAKTAIRVVAESKSVRTTNKPKPGPRDTQTGPRKFPNKDAEDSRDSGDSCNVGGPEPSSSTVRLIVPAGESSRLSPEAAPFIPATSLAADRGGSEHQPTKPSSVGTRGRGRQPVSKPSTDREQELKQLARRYASHGFRQSAGGKEGSGSVVLTFDKPIEDPDFPFDLASLRLRITLPPNYPRQAPPNIEVLNGEVPPAVRARIQNRLADQARVLVGGEPFVRALLRILDQHLERWMVALPTLDTSSGNIKVIPIGEVGQSSPNGQGVDDDENGVGDARKTSESSFHQNHGPDHAVGRHIDDGELGAEANVPPSSPFDLSPLAHSLEMLKVGVPVKKELAGVVGRFHPPSHVRLDQPPPGPTARAGAIQLDLVRVSMSGVALVVPMVLGLSLACGRCRARTSLLDLLPDRDRIVPCSSCKQHMEVSWTRELLHEHCHRFGLVRCKRCSPADLLPCTVQIGCGQCDPPTGGDALANVVQVEGLQVGEKLSFPCRQCHRFLGLSYEAVQWTAIPALAMAASGRGSTKSQPLPTRVGEPLPGLGTCAHYRKSHRWFRFPCCGQAYPCDECHQEANPGHPVEWATRQICGYCSREFSTSQKHCECGEMPGEAARRTAHWEGGKGTRDQLTMSKKDKKKYRSLTKK